MPLATTTLEREFGSIQVGDVARLLKTITADDVQAFAALSGDRNPLHLSREFARQTSFGRPVAHGMLLASYVSAMVGMELPGPGALWSKQEFRWLAPVFEGDTIELTLRVTQKSAGSNTIRIEVQAVNQNGKAVMDGSGTVLKLDSRRRSSDRKLSDRVAFVTGSSRGIGAAIAMALGDAGASVAVHYRDRHDQAGDVCSAIESSGGRAMTVQADIADASAVSRAVDKIQQAFGQPVDVLVNNASIPPTPRPFLGMPWEDLQSLWDVQVRGAFHCCQAALPAMVARGSGRIVNVGSIMARSVPPPQWTAFIVAKAALHALTRSLAVEFGPRGIQVNTVAPGIAETESMAAIPERLRKVQAMQTPLRRLAAPEDVAAAVVFLCSEGGEYVTGAEIPVCGGMDM